MGASIHAMRRVVLSSLFEHLKLNYDFERPADAFVTGQISDQEVDILLSYKSDPKLGELRDALARLEKGTYGICIGCKQELSRVDLENDPARRICARCESAFAHGSQEIKQSQVSYTLR